MGFGPMALSYQLFYFVVQPLHLQPILKGLPGDANHVADTDRLEQAGVGEFIGRSAADTENGAMSFTVYVLLWGVPFSLVLIK